MNVYLLNLHNGLKKYFPTISIKKIDWVIIPLEFSDTKLFEENDYEFNIAEKEEFIELKARIDLKAMVQVGKQPNFGLPV
jgi:hypothetical protein